ncbi:hypothetical protein [Caenibius sp. WL]|uniref:hypothetical protein n=1 Tax=Caenibius sp. WL TaxID=2872646 RepID=UPI001C99C2A1|nr:hypothetical protein [Caenibius sp. WL]QZP06800.1 hypothetical protein K5X80_08670 [Caenibius sp. WL]
MPTPNLDDMTDWLDSTCRDYLGEPIQYKASAAGAYVGVRGHVDYRDMVKPLEGAEAIAQDITVALMIADVPVKPAKAARLQLAKHPGTTFRPINVRRDESGTHWEFEVVEADA